MFQWFESRIEAFPDEPPARPPPTLLAYYLHFIKPVWPAFAVLLVAGFLGALIEVALMAFIGKLVDLMKAAVSPGDFLSQHGPTLTWMAFVAVVARPVVSTVHDLIKNQIISAPVTNRVRWLTHRYVLRQSLGFFQNDFAGRVANKIMQGAPALRESVVQVIDAIWYAAVQWLGAAVIFAAADWRLLAPLLIWLAAYFGALLYFVPRIKERSTEAAEARSALVGRIVDSYTNILTVKLFARPKDEDEFVRAAVDEHTRTFRRQLRLITLFSLTLTLLNASMVVGTGVVAVWLWIDGKIAVGIVAMALPLTWQIANIAGWVAQNVTAIFENVGVVQDGMRSISVPRLMPDKPNAATLKVERAPCASRMSASATAPRAACSRASASRSRRASASV